MHTNFEFRRLYPLQEQREEADVKNEKTKELEKLIAPYEGKVTELLLNAKSIPGNYETIAWIQVPQENADKVEALLKRDGWDNKYPPSYARPYGAPAP